MDPFSLIVLSFVQAVTEFIPVSSSGHLTLFQSLFGLVPSLGLDVFLNTATLVSVCIFFYPRLRSLFSWFSPILVGSLPAAVVALVFGDQLEAVFSSASGLKFTFLLTSAFLLSTRFLRPGSQKLTLTRAFLIGIFQAVAILPGVSRSGATIFAGLLLGLPAPTAFLFSFGLFIPASLGAIFLKREAVLALGLPPSLALVSFAITLLVGYLALFTLEKIVVSRRLWLFGVYTLLLALFLFLFPGLTIN